MTKRYPLGSAFGGGNSGNPGDLQRVALGRFAAAHLRQGGWADAHESMRGGLPHSGGLGADVHHGHFCALAKMGEFSHSRPRRGSTMAISPASHCSFSGDTTRNELDSAIATTSPDPCHGRAETSGSPRTLWTRAGRKCVNSLRSLSACASRARNVGSGRASAPLSKSIAGTTKSSNVTMVDT